jgi:hypothetical protein
MTKLSAAFCMACVSLAALATQGVEFPYPTPAKHLRIVTWNIQDFNETTTNRTARTSAQLDSLARRIVGFDAAVIALNEINHGQLGALHDLRERMNAQVGSSRWQVLSSPYTLPIVGYTQTNAMLYDTSKVEEQAHA